jgi:hypothetical protein
MSRISLPKLVLVLVLATALAAPSAGWSAGRRFSGDSTWVRGSVTANPLVMLWSYLVGLWGKEGCGLDPSGMCKTILGPSKSSDAGCGIDPSGCGVPSSYTAPKNGCGIDPHGGCVSPAGCGLDPHGNCISGN